MNSAPVRIRRRRTRGWRKPPETVIVDRTSRWGNPFRHTDPGQDRDTATTRYQHWLTHDPAGQRVAIAARKQLAGQHLACPCPDDGPCHADVLLSVANPQHPGRPIVAPIRTDLTDASALRQALSWPRIAAPRALSIRQPWTSLILAGAKPVENRTWSTRHRGWTMLHAGRTWDSSGAHLAEQLGVSVPATRTHYPYGLLGAAFLTDVHHADDCRGCSPWSTPGVYHWVFHDPIVWPQAVPSRGILGLYRLRPEHLSSL